MVTVNAYQRTMHTPRLDELAKALTTRAVSSTGGVIAPDVILIQEIVGTPLRYLQDQLNAMSNATNATYAIVGGITSAEGDMKVKALLNTATMKFDRFETWTDACTTNRIYQIIHATEIASGKPVAAAGVHIAPMSSAAGTDECKRQNAEKTRQVMAPYDDTGSIVGDFNRRAMEAEYECDPDETKSPAMPWYSAITAKAANGYSYQGTVRTHHRPLGTLKDQWTFEFPTAETLCNGEFDERRMRMDYIFTSSTMGVVEARADDPGWGGATPGVIGCSPAPQCKYSDHRFVWARLRLPAPPPPPATATSVHVGDLDATRTLVKGGWRATVKISVHDNLEAPVGGATVAYRWSAGTTKPQTCNTTTAGTCTVTSTTLKTNAVTLSVSNVSASGLTYDAAVSHHPDGDSAGTSMTIAK